MDYSKTLNLPETSFSVKADSAKSELEILSIWKDLDIYKKRQQLNKGKPKFLVHNLPQLAHSYVCIDDALNMILKDIIVKHKLMCGFDVPHFPSWNCHTASIEREALKSLEGKGGGKKPSEVQKQCQSLCLEYTAFQKEQFQRLGIFAYWDKAVSTLNSDYKSRMIEAFGDLYEAGYLYKGAKPTRWCVNCQTDLTETEIEYRDYKLLSLYVKFPVIHGLEELGEDVYMVVCISTPWTLPANTSVAIHPDCDYAAIEMENGEILIMAADAVENTIRITQDTRRMTQDARQEEKVFSLESRVLSKAAAPESDEESGVLSLPYRIARKMKGSELDEIVYAHPLLDRDCGILLDRHVALANGTGCIHATPKYNQEDYTAVQQRYPELISVDQNGQLTEEAGQFCGLNVFESSDFISLELEKRGCLLASKPVERPYPHCSYCKKPAIVRVAGKWVFDLNANNLRQRILKVVEEVNWLPGWGRNRISNTIANRLNWSVSLRRTWGIPTPVFYCSKCNSQVDTAECINASKNLIIRKGINRWLTAKPSDILSDDVVCSHCGGRDFRWEEDILDAEFVSAMSYKAVFPNKKAPSLAADICLGSDGQYEKWFQFSLLPSMAIEGVLPFKSALVHGLVVDENGKRISRSENGLQEILNEFGADILRLWAISMDCKKCLKISHSRLELVSKVYQRIKNTCRFMLGNLSGFDPESDKVDYTYLQEIDRWALYRLAKLIDGTTKALENCQFHVAYRLLYNFCSADMSSLYFSIVKQRLYTFPRWSSSRRAVQTAIYEILTSLVRLIAPILSFTAEEVWRHIPGIKKDYPSVYLLNWPDVNRDFLNGKLESRWNCLLRVRSEIYRLLEKVRQEEDIHGSSQASVILYASSSDVYDVLDRYIDDLEAVFMVSKVRLMPPDASIPDGTWRSDDIKGLAIEIRRATGEKCERCWSYSDTVGTNEQYPALCYRCIAILEGGTYYI